MFDNTKDNCLRRKFFWGWGTRSKYLAWVRSEKVICDTKSGGLGEGSFRGFNLGLLGKWLWRCKSEEGALWHRIISSIYGRYGGSNSNFNSRKLGDASGGVIKAIREMED